MTPLKLIRSIGKMVRGGASPTQILLACILGVMIGMTPGFNLTLVIGIVLVLLLNVNLGLTLMGVALGKALMYALAPVTFGLGRTLITGPLNGLFTAMANTPVLALMGPNWPSLVGGLILGAALGAILGAVLAATIVSVRRGVLAAGQHSEKVAKAGRNIVVRLLLRVLFGKQKESLAELLEAKTRLFRKVGVALVVLLALVVAAAMVAPGMFFKDSLRYGIENANGAQVDIETARLSVAGGSVEVAGLRITDPGKPTHNSFQLESLVGDISVSNLLAGRVVIDELSVKDPRTDVKRDTPGKVLGGQGVGGQGGGGAGTTTQGSGGKAVEDEETQKKKQLEQLDALRRELAAKFKSELDEIVTEYVDKQVDAQLAKLAKLPEAVRAEARKKVDVDVKQRLDAWTKKLADDLADQVIEQIKKQDTFAEYANEALKYRKYTPYIDKAREKLAARKSGDKSKKLDADLEALGYFAVRINLTSHPSWIIRKLTMENLALGDGGTYTLVGTNISGRPEMIDEPMHVTVRRSGGPPAVLAFGFSDGAYYGPSLTLMFDVALKDVAGSKLPDCLAEMTFNCLLTGGLNATPQLDVDTHEALDDLKTKAADHIQAEVARQVRQVAEKVLKDAAGGLLKGIDVPGLLKGKDGKKPDTGGLLDGVLGGDKDRDKDGKDKKSGLGGLLDGALDGALDGGKDKDKDDKDKDKKDPLKSARELL